MDDIEKNEGVQTFEFKNGNSLINDDDEVPVPLSIKKTKRNRYIAITISLTTIVLMIYTAAAKMHIALNYVHDLHTYLQDIYKENSLLVLGIILLILIINYICILPTQTLINIVAAFIIGDGFTSWAILVIFSSISGSIVYLICRFFLKDFLTKKFQGNILYDILQEESQSSPYKIAFMTRIIHIPAGIKEYILSLSGNPFPSFFISGLCIHGFFCLEAVLIAQGVSNVHEYMTQKKNWSDKTTFEKLSFLVVVASIILTILILIAVSYWANRKIKARKMRRKLELEIKS